MSSAAMPIAHTTVSQIATDLPLVRGGSTSVDETGFARPASGCVGRVPEGGGFFDDGGFVDGSADTTVFASAIGSGTLSWAIATVLLSVLAFAASFLSCSLTKSERRTSFVSASGGSGNSGGVGGLGTCELGFSGCVAGGAEIGWFDDG